MTEIKVSSGVSEGGDSGWNPVSGGGRTPELSKEVTDSNEESINVRHNSSLNRNDGEGVIREDTVDNRNPNGTMTKEIKFPSETETPLEANNDEICLAQLFGAAKIVGSGLTAPKNPKARDKLSGKPQPNKSRATTKDRAQKNQQAVQSLSGLAEIDTSIRKKRQRIFNSMEKREKQIQQWTTLVCLQKGFRWIAVKTTHLVE
nr:hypothetical protein CFP56_74527 [Quercus suber]